MNAYEQRYREALDAIAPGLGSDLLRIVDLPESVGRRVVRLLLELACESQHIANIQLGRSALERLPREWLLPIVRQFEQELLARDPEWEGRRLCELYEQIDPSRARELAARLRS